jgi:hypothetical protein
MALERAKTAPRARHFFQKRRSRAGLQSEAA